MQVLCGVCAAVICCVCVPLYGFLKLSDGEGQYETHTYQHSYFMSAAMLNGGLPASLILAVWSLLVIPLCWFLCVCVNCAVGNRAERFRYNLRQKSLLVLYVAANAAVSLGVNGLYVAVLLSDQSSTVKVAVQVCVALFRLVWGQLISSVVVHPLFGGYVHHRSVLLGAVFVLSNIVTPCLVIAFSDPSCFVDLLMDPTAVISTYRYPQCKFFQQTPGE